MKKIKLKIAHKDNRGEIIDILENEKINSITLITLKKGAIRGNHYHKKTYQWNYIISGKMKLITKYGNKKKTIILKPGELALTKPLHSHTLIGVTYCKCLVFTKGPRAGKNYEIDTYRLKNKLV
tara:strand:+ start:392 stop:763 length:372 start_codon:yes stop_codon:yes gene_type:complete